MLYSITINKNFYNDNDDMIKNEKTTMFFNSIIELGEKLADAELEETIYFCENQEIEPCDNGYIEYSMTIDKLNDKEFPVNSIQIINPYL